MDFFPKCGKKIGFETGVSKARVVALRNKIQSIGLHECYQLMIFFDPMKIFDPVLAVQKLIFGKFCEKGEVFSLSEPISAAL